MNALSRTSDALRHRASLRSLLWTVSDALAPLSTVHLVESPCTSNSRVQVGDLFLDILVRDAPEGSAMGRNAWVANTLCWMAVFWCDTQALSAVDVVELTAREHRRWLCGR